MPFLYRCDVVGHDIAANLVTFIDRYPQCTGFGLKGQAVRVAQPCRIGCQFSCVQVQPVYSCPSFLGLHAIIGDIAVGAYGHIQETSIRAGEQVLCSMMVVACRQIRNLGSWRVYPRVALMIGKTENGVGIGDIEIIAHQGHPEG